ncbi:MAG: hypothetical protein ABIP20_20380, partial [Chthoniobacteraceae bacterium]
VQAMLKAEGETIDFRATMRDPVPEAENFCAIPLLKDLALVVDGDENKGAPAEKRKRFAAVKLPSGNNGAGRRPRIASAVLGSHLDVKAWAEWLRKEGTLTMPADSGDAARDVLGALSEHDGVFQELTAGLSRPKAQWTPEWKTREFPENLFSIALPNYDSVRGVGQTLALRAIAATRAGEPAKAHESALILTRLSETSMNDPFLIGLLVGAADTQVLCGVTWELCAAHLGTAEDFARLESALAQRDFHRALLQAFRSEMAAAVNTLQNLKVARGSAIELFTMMNSETGNNGGLLASLATRAVPSGFLDASTAVLADREFHHMIKPLRDKGWAAAFQAAKDFEREIVSMKPKAWMHPSWIMTAMIAPAINRITYGAAYAQTLIDQAVIACALERHRIERGIYPDSLDAVKLADGKSLPLDAMNGKAMGYRRTADGRYVIWSVGFDGKDDGGKRVLDEKKPEDTKFHDAKYVGDWVWDFPAK